MEKKDQRRIRILVNTGVGAAVTVIVIAVMMWVGYIFALAVNAAFHFC